MLRAAKRGRKTLLILAVAIVALSFLFFLRHGPGLLPDAYIAPEGDAFALYLSRRGGIMVHDPVSLIVQIVCPTTYLDTQKIVVPRDQGEIDGAEIPVAHGYYGYLGTIRIAGPELDVNLRADNTDDHTQDPSIWNGQYHLQPGTVPVGSSDFKECYE